MLALCKHLYMPDLCALKNASATKISDQESKLAHHNLPNVASESKLVQHKLADVKPAEHKIHQCHHNHNHSHHNHNNELKLDEKHANNPVAKLQSSQQTALPFSKLQSSQQTSLPASQHDHSDLSHAHNNRSIQIKIADHLSPLCNPNTYDRKDGGDPHRHRRKLMKRVQNDLQLDEDFDTRHLTAKKLKQLVHLIDEHYYDNEIHRLMKQQNVTLEYCVQHLPKKEYSAVIEYKGERRAPVLQICVNTAQYMSLNDRVNNGVRVTCRLENCIVDVLHELWHLVVFMCLDNHVLSNELAHKGLFAHGNQVMYGHTTTYYEDIPEEGHANTSRSIRK